MQFCNDSGIIIKTLVSNFSKCQPKYFSSTTFKNDVNKITDVLYNDIKKGEKYIKNKITNKCYQTKILQNEDIIIPKGYKSNFFPEYIRKYIDNHCKSQLVYSCKIAEHPITIRVGLFNNEKLEKLEKEIRLMFVWLYMCYQYSDINCAKTLDIYLFFTPFKKILPSRNTEILGAEHVNTGFSYQCSPNGEIIIYREEEWMKVFIHETFHAFGFDIDVYSEKISI